MRVIGDEDEILRKPTINVGINVSDETNDFA